MAAKASHLTTMSSYQQVADRLGICLNTARKLVEEGRLTAVHVSDRCVRIRDSEVEQFIARQSAGNEGAAR